MQNLCLCLDGDLPSMKKMIGPKDEWIPEEEDSSCFAKKRFLLMMPTKVMRMVQHLDHPMGTTMTMVLVTDRVPEKTRVSGTIVFFIEGKSPSRFKT